MKIKTGDTVAIIAGGDQFVTDKKGVVSRKTGTVLRVFPDTQRVTVEGVNKTKRHERPTQGDESGGIFEVESPIHVSNVALIDPETNQPTRVRYETVEDKKGNKQVVRVAVKSGARIDK